MEIIELKTEPRLEVGKGQVKKLRARGKLPVNLYGFETNATNLAIDEREFNTMINSQAGTHVILKLHIEGSKAPLVIVKDIQRDPVKDHIIHIDFLSVALDEKITAPVAISIVGNSAGVKSGGVVQHGLWEVQIEALPTDLPDHIDVDITNLELGESLHAGELPLPGNLTMVTPSDDIVVSVVQPAVYKEAVVPGEEAAPEEPQAGAEPSEVSEES